MYSATTCVRIWRLARCQLAVTGHRRMLARTLLATNRPSVAQPNRTVLRAPPTRPGASRSAAGAVEHVLDVGQLGNGRSSRSPSISRSVIRSAGRQLLDLDGGGSPPASTASR